MTQEQKRDPMISPLFMNLNKLKVSSIFERLSREKLIWRSQLPPALFTCGTLDPLLDDSVMLSAKWAMSGAESVLKVCTYTRSASLIRMLV